MNPVAVQIPGVEESVIAKDQPEYIPVPTIHINTHEGQGLLTRWRPSDEERAQITAGADVWVQHLTFGGPMQPLKLLTECPVDPPGEPS